MALKYAPLCSRCGERRTKSPTGLCCRCQLVSTPSKPCKVCGAIKTKHPSGLCYRCRPNAEHGDDIEKAIETHLRAINVLELRRANMSYSQIAATLSISKSTAHSIYHTAMGLPDWDIADGTDSDME